VRLPWALVAALSIALIAGLLAWAPWRPAPVRPETRTEINTPATDDPGSFALSPDGRQIVFAASGDGARRLWLRSLATTTAQPLPGTEGGRFPFWSPDSRSIGFFAYDALKRLDLGGGAPQTLAAALNNAYGGTWNAAGVVLFAPGATTPLRRVSATGGEAVALTTLGPQQSGHRSPHFLPDGRHFLFFGYGTPDSTGIYLGALDGRSPTRLTPADSDGVYLPSGWLLWVRAGTLVARRLDVVQAALLGDPVTLADAVAAISVAATGEVAYRTGVGNPRQLAWVDRSGKALGSMGAPDEDNLVNPSISPDGRRVVVRRGVQGSNDIWLLDGIRMSRLTPDTALDGYPIWSPDGNGIVFTSNRKGYDDLYQRSSSGAGADELLVESQQPKYATDWSADGRFLLFHSIDPQTARDLWVVRRGGAPSVFLKTPFNERHGTFSPDGRWVAYISNESSRDEIYIRPFAAPVTSGTPGGTERDVRLPSPERSRREPDPADGRWPVSTTGGAFPRWRRDGKELYYLSPAGEMMAAPITVTGATLEPGAPVRLFPTRIYGGGADNGQGRQYDVARDGRFLINTVLGDATAAPITLLQNWNPEVKK